MTAVASPIRNPRGHQGRLATQSATHRATSRMSTCPNRTWSLIGIRYAHATMSSPNTHGAYFRSRGPSSTCRNENPTVTASAT